MHGGKDTPCGVEQIVYKWFFPQLALKLFFIRTLSKTENISQN